MTGSPPAPDSHGGPDQHQPRPDVRWVRHRPSLGPLPRWGLVAALVLLTLVIGYRLFFRRWLQVVITHGDGLRKSKGSVSVVQPVEICTIFRMVWLQTKIMLLIPVHKILADGRGLSHVHITIHKIRYGAQ